MSWLRREPRTGLGVVVVEIKKGVWEESKGFTEREICVAMGISRNPALTNDSELYRLTELGPQAIVSCAIVVSRTFCGHREIEDCSSS